jgi:hypothetical protein
MRSSVSLYIPHKEVGEHAGLVETLSAFLIEGFFGFPHAFQVAIRSRSLPS